jgi:hypothetical protein
MSGPENYIKEINQSDLDAKSIKIDSQQLDALLELKFQTYIAQDNDISRKY